MKNSKHSSQPDLVKRVNKLSIGAPGGVILIEDLKNALTPDEYNDLSRWLMGQTMTANGPFSWDVERWAKKQPVID